MNYNNYNININDNFKDAFFKGLKYNIYPYNLQIENIHDISGRITGAGLQLLSLNNIGYFIGLDTIDYIGNTSIYDLNIFSSSIIATGILLEIYSNNYL